MRFFAGAGASQTGGGMGCAGSLAGPLDTEPVAELAATTTSSRELLDVELEEEDAVTTALTLTCGLASLSSSASSS